jgi:hypothetical protein
MVNERKLHPFLVLVALAAIALGGCTESVATRAPTPTPTLPPVATPTTVRVSIDGVSTPTVLDLEAMRALLTDEDIAKVASKPVMAGATSDLRGTLNMTQRMETRLGTRFVAADESNQILFSIVDLVSDEAALQHFRELILDAIVNREEALLNISPMIGEGSVYQTTNPMTVIFIKKDKVIELSTLIFSGQDINVVDLEGLKDLAKIIASRL